MKKKSEMTEKPLMEKFSSVVTQVAGSTKAFIVALAIVMVWAATGPVFDYSETWQLVINTGTTIITFLMVFIIQKSQNKESLAVQLKLNEIIAAHTEASNRLIDVENLTEAELKTIHDYYCILKEKAKEDENLRTSHSVEEATENHELKMQSRSKK
jgi:low affinity Fe/Cu permease